MARPAQQEITEQTDKQNTEQDSYQPDIYAGVTVENMTELMGDYPLQFFSVEKIQRTLSNTDDRIIRGVTCRKSVYAGFVDKVNRRYTDTRCNGHFLDDV